MKLFDKYFNKFRNQLNKSLPDIESLKSEGDNVTLKFFNRNTDEKIVDQKFILIVLGYLTAIILISILVFQMHSESARIDKFHRDIIGRCIDKNWEVSLYKDGQLESCHIPRTIE